MKRLTYLKSSICVSWVIAYYNTKHPSYNYKIAQIYLGLGIATVYIIIEVYTSNTTKHSWIITING